MSEKISPEQMGLNKTPDIEARMIAGAVPFPTDHAAVFAEEPALQAAIDLGELCEVACVPQHNTVDLHLIGKDSPPVVVELVYAVTVDVGQGALNAAKRAQKKGFPTREKLGEWSTEEDSENFGRLRVFAYLSDTEEHPGRVEVYLRTVDKEGAEALITAHLSPGQALDLCLQLREAYIAIKGSKKVVNLCVPKMQAEQEIAQGRAAARAIERGDGAKTL